MISERKEMHLRFASNLDIHGRKMSTFPNMSTFLLCSSGDDRKTFSGFHYMVLPIYWSGKVWDSLKMDKTLLESHMEAVVDNYAKMSWNKLNLTYTLLDQTEFTMASTDKFWAAKSAAMTLLENQGYVHEQDYDAILFVYHPLGGNGDFCCEGGLAALNGPFATVTYKPSMQVTRHEIGHNLGHYHHSHNTYKYRDDRPYKPGMTDGFDMVSG